MTRKTKAGPAVSERQGSSLLGRRAAGSASSGAGGASSSGNNGGWGDRNSGGDSASSGAADASSGGYSSYLSFSAPLLSYLATMGSTAPNYKRGSADTGVMCPPLEYRRYTGKGRAAFRLRLLDP